MKETTFLRVQNTLYFVNSTRNILHQRHSKRLVKHSLQQLNESQKRENPGLQHTPLSHGRSVYNQKTLCTTTSDLIIGDRSCEFFSIIPLTAQ